MAVNNTPIANSVGNSIGISAAGSAVGFLRDTASALIQNKINLQNWNRQNVYNSPSAQLQRLRDAGLNPMFYGLDGTGNADAMAAASMPSSGNPFDGAAQLVGQLPLMAAQINDLNASANDKNAGADLKASLKTAQEIENEIKASTKDDRIEISHTEVLFEKGKVEEQQKSIAQIQANTEKVRQDMSVQLEQLSLDQRRVALLHAQFEFQKWLDMNNFSLDQRRVAVDEFNAATQSALVGAQVPLLHAETTAHELSNFIRDANKNREIKADAQRMNATRQTAVASAWIKMAGDAVDVVGDCVSIGVKSAVKGALGAGKDVLSQPKSMKDFSDAWQLNQGSQMFRNPLSGLESSGRFHQYPSQPGGFLK